jgi:Domain of unknown function (DUF4307)
VTVGTEPSTHTLDDRYGRTKNWKLRNRAVFVILGVVIVVVFTAWVVWGGLLTPGAQIDTDDIGSVVHSSSLTTVRYQLAVDPGTAVKCAAEALDENFSVVGWKIIDVPASDAHTRVLSTDVRTTQRAASGLIYSCWLP